MAAPDDGDRLVPEEGAVADAAVADAAALVLVLTGDAQALPAYPRGDDHRLCLVEAHPRVDHEVTEIAESYHRFVPNLGAEPQGLLDHIPHEVLAADAVGETGVVVYPVGLDRLAAGLPAL